MLSYKILKNGFNNLNISFKSVWQANQNSMTFSIKIISLGCFFLYSHMVHSSVASSQISATVS